MRPLVIAVFSMSAGLTFAAAPAKAEPAKAEAAEIGTEMTVAGDVRWEELESPGADCSVSLIQDASGDFTPKEMPKSDPKKKAPEKK